MPTLEWIGKNKVVNHHQEVPFRVLERQYSFDEQGQHTENNGSENMIIHGDNPACENRFPTEKSLSRTAAGTDRLWRCGAAFGIQQFGL